MKRGISCGVLVVAILTLCIGPNIVWAEDTRSRIYQLESRVDYLENQVPYTGVHYISTLDWVPLYNTGWLVGPGFIGLDGDYLYIYPRIAWAPIHIRFKCTITEVEFKAKVNIDAEDIVLIFHNGVYDSDEELIPLFSVNTSDAAYTSTAAERIFTTGTLDPLLLHDPTNFAGGQVWYIVAQLNDDARVQKLRWVKIYYTVP